MDMADYEVDIEVYQAGLSTYGTSHAEYHEQIRQESRDKYFFPLKTEFRPWLRQVRIERGMRIRDLANLTSISCDKIGRIENLKSKLTLNLLVRLAFGLGLDAREVFAAIGLPIAFMDYYASCETTAMTLLDVEDFLKRWKSDCERAWRDLVFKWYLPLDEEILGVMKFMYLEDEWNEHSHPDQLLRDIPKRLLELLISKKYIWVAVCFMAAMRTPTGTVTSPHINLNFLGKTALNSITHFVWK